MGYHRTYTGKPSASITLSLYLTGIEPFSGIWSYNLGSFFYVFPEIFWLCTDDSLATTAISAWTAALYDDCFALTFAYKHTVSANHDPLFKLAKKYLLVVSLDSFCRHSSP